MYYRTRINELRRKRALEENRDVTLTEIARSVGVSRQTIHRYANKALMPSFEIAVRLADYFGVSIEELLVPADDQGQEVAVAAP
ncbi:MAG: hypothetical protein KatS3mg051_1440 [Anaerolineae bacterium]|nr:MAG: hypothetical protein KatS3mg051_1440 [Anaerolineae bacterium]